jgi:hypothetical protein
MSAKKTLLAVGVTTAVGLATFAGVASAQTPAPIAIGGPDGQQTLVDKLATKFNLNKDEVQKVFDEQQDERQARMQERVEARLAEAVADGKITTEQKDAILEKQKEVRNYFTSLDSKSDDERHALMKEKMDELRQWAQDNGLSEYLGKPMGHMGAAPLYKFGAHDSGVEKQ